MRNSVQIFKGYVADSYTVKQSTKESGSKFDRQQHRNREMPKKAKKILHNFDWDSEIGD